MRLLKRFSALCLSAVILFSFPVAAQAQTKSGSIFDSKTYTHQTQFDKCSRYQGVDLSKHNGTVDFAKMKKAGVKYVILRAGYRGYAEEGTLNKDIKFETYIKDAIKQGLNIGIYFYSQAVSNKEAQAEAKYTINIIKNYKKYITLPVAFDYEFAEVSSGRFDKRWKNGTLNKKKCTNIALSYCNYIQDAGYNAMVYANKSFLSEVIDGKSISKTYPIWMANYTTNTTYSGSFFIWQFSSTGKISGVSGSVDSNFLYSTDGLKPVTTLPQFKMEKIPNQTYTGEAITPEVKITYEGKELTKDTDYTVKYANNKEIGSATVTVTGKNKYKNVDTGNFTFAIVPKPLEEAPELVERGIDNLKIKWKAQKGISGYRASYKKGGKWVNLDNIEDTEYLIHDIVPAYTHKIVVQTYKTVNGKRYYSHISPIAKIATKPAKVQNLKVTHRTGISISLKWQKQSGATKYIVYRYNFAKEKYEKWCEIEGGKNNTAVVKNLVPNKKHKFRVRAVKVAETGETFNGAPSKTTTDYTTPQSPVLNSAVSNSTKKISMNWERIYSAQGYQIMYSTSSTFAKNNKTKKIEGKNNVNYTLSVPKSKKNYYIKVRSYRVRGDKTYYSPWSNKLKVTTK